MEKETKTVINVGWNAVNSLTENFENYAAKGYILTEMNDKLFTFTKSEPKKCKFMLYKGKRTDKNRELENLFSDGWKIICSYENYCMLINEDTEKFTETKKAPPQKNGRGVYISYALLWAVFFYIDFRFIPPSSEILIAVRFILAAFLASAFVYSVVRAFRS